jgi:glycosyltransferase involved in cell wall biosynthesis
MLGGAERLVATLGKAAPHAGLDIQVVVLSAADGHPSIILPLLRAAGVEPTYLSISRLAEPRAVPRLARAIRDSRCDVVHAHLEYAAVLAPAAARIAGIPAVCTLHHVPERLPAREATKERLAVFSGSRARALIFVSKASMSAFAARYRPRPKSWVVIPNGVDLSVFRSEPAAFPADLGIPEGTPVVTMVAAMRGRKGHELAIEAWPQVRQDVPDARLLLIGSGAMEPHLRRLAAGNGTAATVIFAGSRTDVPGLLRASSLVILPSEAEALPTVLIEAAACAKAVVASDVGGVSEIVDHRRTGLLIPPRDGRALATAIVQLLADPDRRREMGEAGRRLAEAQFDMRSWAVRLRDVYEHGPMAPAYG